MHLGCQQPSAPSAHAPPPSSSHPSCRASASRLALHRLPCSIPRVCPVRMPCTSLSLAFSPQASGWRWAIVAVADVEAGLCTDNECAGGRKRKWRPERAQGQGWATASITLRQRRAARAAPARSLETHFDRGAHRRRGRGVRANALGRLKREISTKEFKQNDSLSQQTGLID